MTSEQLYVLRALKSIVLVNEIVIFTLDYS